MIRICINCSNLHNGGGVQVASSFICELANLDFSEFDVNVFVSSSVDSNVQDFGIETSDFSSYIIANNYGIKSLFFDFSVDNKGYDLIFTVFGPNYSLFNSGLKITGFAQPWILNPKNQIYKEYSFFKKLESRVKYFIQKIFFLFSDALIVELDHVKKGLLKIKLFKFDDIHIVHNCVSSIYFDKKRWAKLDFIKEKHSINIGFVGRDYSHKNTKVLPSVKKILILKYGIDINFYVTFSSFEFEKKTSEFKELVNNVGVLSAAQCPTFYKNMDGIIFPSLLECFSATPFEALIMEVPLFASDRSFVRDVCAEFAFYFEPTDPESIAFAIASYFLNGKTHRDALKKKAKSHVLSFSTPKNRAIEYLNIIRKYSK